MANQFESGARHGPECRLMNDLGDIIEPFEAAPSAVNSVKQVDRVRIRRKKDDQNEKK